MAESGVVGVGGNPAGCLAENPLRRRELVVRCLPLSVLEAALEERGAFPSTFPLSLDPRLWRPCARPGPSRHSYLSSGRFTKNVRQVPSVFPSLREGWPNEVRSRWVSGNASRSLGVASRLLSRTKSGLRERFAFLGSRFATP